MPPKKEDKVDTSDGMQNPCLRVGFNPPDHAAPLTAAQTTSNVGEDLKS